MLQLQQLQNNFDRDLRNFTRVVGYGIYQPKLVGTRLINDWCAYDFKTLSTIAQQLESKIELDKSIGSILEACHEIGKLCNGADDWREYARIKSSAFVKNCIDIVCGNLDEQQDVINKLITYLRPDDMGRYYSVRNVLKILYQKTCELFDTIRRNIGRILCEEYSDLAKCVTLLCIIFEKLETIALTQTAIDAIKAMLNVSQIVVDDQVVIPAIAPIIQDM